MRIAVIGLALVCSVVHISCAAVTGSRKQPATSQEKRGDLTTGQVNQEDAIRLAKETAVKEYGSVEAYHVIPCEQAALWRIFFEPKNGSGKSNGIEYVISREKSWVISRRDIALPARSETLKPAIDKQQALVIAKKDAVAAYHSLEPYEAITCELSTAWIVVFSLKRGLDGGGPEYVVNKETGTILDKKYYQ